MSGLLIAIAAADEEFLIALANKGLYKRAQRELDEADIAAVAEGETVTATFADGTVVTMEGSIQNYKCSCPSRSICKHLLMAVLAAKSLGGEVGETSAGGGGKLPAQPVADFSGLADTTVMALEKLAGKKQLRAAVLAVHFGEKATIDEGSTLAVTLADSGRTVRFLPGAPPEDSSCTCKSADFCVHRAQAVVQYIASKKGALPAEFLPSDEENPLEFGVYTLPYIRDFVDEVFSTGLARLPEGSAGRFTQLATICHSQRLANMERLCNRVAGQLEHFAARSATFQRDYLLADICELLALCDAIEREGGSRETVGVFRETYRPVAQMELWGLGAYGWHSTGGYTGVTTLFFCPGQEGVLTHTSAMPDSAAGSAEKLYAGAAPWGLPTKLSAISHTRLTLKGGKLSDKGQLSSSESGIAQPQGAVDIYDDVLASIRFDDFALLLAALWRHMEQNDGPMTVLLSPARAGSGNYDKIRQQWTLPLYDGAERKLLLSVRYEATARLLLENLMERDEAGALATPLLARVTIQGGQLTAFPVTHYGQEACNLSLDRPKQKKINKKSFFDWGI